MSKDTIRSLDVREQCRYLGTDRMYLQKFGRLTVHEIVYINKHYMKKYRCVCECGNETITYGGKLTTGHTKSCGCLQKEKAYEKCKQGIKYDGEKHFVQAWKGMRDRANNISYSGYTPNYIWEYDKFKKDMYESYLEHVKEHGEHNTTLDRIDGKKGYTPDNCRWATWIVQGNNKSEITHIEYNGMKLTFREWVSFYNSDIDLRIIKNRVNTYGWDIKRACTEPINTKFRRKDYKTDVEGVSNEQ